MAPLRMYAVLFLIGIFTNSFSQVQKAKQIQVLADKQLKDELYADVKFLTTVTPSRNHRNIDVLNKAADYILNEFRKLNCKTEIQKFSVQGKEFKNIMASFGNLQGERIIVGAHYDVAGNTPGADDNGSGVAGLLALARKFNQAKVNSKYRFDFVAYSLEEPPYFATANMGSAMHAKLLKDNDVVVKAMICLEMIGYFSDEPDSQNFPDETLKRMYPNKGNFIIAVGIKGKESFTENVKQLMKKNCSIDVQSISLPTTNQLAGLSDHRNYWAYGYPAVMIDDTSFLRNPNYHSITDTIETLDFNRMTEVVKGVFGMITNL
jgi:hypothetical protein